MAELSAEVLAFLHRGISSVLALEVLLALRATPGSCGARSLSRQLGGSADAVIRALIELEKTGLVERTSGEADWTYRYSPATGEDASTIDDVAEAYARRRVAVIAAIFSEPDDPLQTFSDASRRRRDE